MIEASRCPACERVAVPPEPRCLACRNETASTELATEGRVLTYTRTEEGWVALIELAGGARVLAEREEQPVLGAQVELEKASLLAGEGAQG